MIKIAEFFAGVGGFSYSLETLSNNALKKPLYRVIWQNQWEPKKKNQFAFNVMAANFPNIESVNADISSLDIKDIPNFDMLVGGFPCQDFSVAKSKTMGLEGEKGKVVYPLLNIIKHKKPKIIFLENVWRLLISPNKENKGRDFNYILKRLLKLGYSISWRVITASDYGFYQKRKRLYIVGFRNDVEQSTTSPLFSIAGGVSEVQEIKKINIRNFFDFPEEGEIIDGKILRTYKTVMEHNQKNTIYDILMKYHGNESEYSFLDPHQIERALKTKSNSSTLREKNGFFYKYSQGKMSFPDKLNRPFRTMLTSEGSINRTSHFLQDARFGNRIRTMHPIEAELANGFPQNWTAPEGVIITSKQRLFLMGNSLITNLVALIGNEIANYIMKEDWDESI